MFFTISSIWTRNDENDNFLNIHVIFVVAWNQNVEYYFFDPIQM